MRLGDEGVQAMEWAYGLLTQSQALADALGTTLEALPDRVWPDPAPSGTEAPFVVFSASESIDHQALGPRARIHTSVPMIVKGLDAARNYDGLAPVARAIYATLVARENDPVSDGGMILTAQREGGIQYPEQAQGVEYRHLGHLLSVEIN